MKASWRYKIKSDTRITKYLVSVDNVNYDYYCYDVNYILSRLNTSRTELRNDAMWLCWLAGVFVAFGIIRGPYASDMGEICVAFNLQHQNTWHLI